MPTSTLAAPRSEPTLDDVRRAIPPSCLERSTGRGLAIAARDTALYVLALAAVIAVDSVGWSLLLAVAAGLFVSAMFVTGHDASHGALLPGRRVNQWVAQLMMLPSLHVRAAWDLGHNRVHHGFTVRQGTDFVWHPLTGEQFRALSPLARLRHRLEWSCIGSGAYYLREVWWNKMIRFRAPDRYAAAIRKDKRIVAGFLTAFVIVAGAIGLLRSEGGIGLTSWPEAAWSVTELVLIPFLVFTQVIGWTVYVHHVQPDTRWYAPKDWTKYRAQMEGTTILRIPKPLDVLFHDIFVHVPHHVDMRIPCYRLREAAVAITTAFPGVVVDRPLRLRDYVAATRVCKLYDFDAGSWLRYSAAD